MRKGKPVKYIPCLAHPSQTCPKCRQSVRPINGGVNFVGFQCWRCPQCQHDWMVRRG